MDSKVKTDTGQVISHNGSISPTKKNAGTLVRPATATPAAHKDFDWWSSVVAPLAVGIILSFIFSKKITRFFLWIKSYFQPSASFLYENEFFQADTQNSAKYFVQNNFDLLNKHNRKLSIPETYQQLDPIGIFIDHLLADSQCPFYMLLAPTGVGKTTFLSNVFLSYKEKTKWKFKPHLYFGKIHNPRTIIKIDELIASGKAADTILLLDALDEFQLPANQTADQFWHFFNRKWNVELLEKRLFQFKKVVVSAREQFFLSSDLENITFDDLDGRKIILQAFTEEAQRRTYIEKRFPGATPAELQKREGILWLIEELNANGVALIEKPLILNFMDLLWQDYQTNGVNIDKKVYFTTEQIYNTVIDYWLRREGKTTDGLSEQTFKSLKKHCQILAFEMAVNRSKSYFSPAELEEIEHNLNNIADLRGVQGRSFLIRLRDPENGVDYPLTEQFRFIHDTFLEFFLVLYINDNPEAESLIPFERYSFAFQVIIGQRWRKSKNSIPNFQAAPLNAHEIGEPTLHELAIFVNYFRNLTSNEPAKALLMEDGYLSNILKKEDPNWQEAFKHLVPIAITNGSFWDSDMNQPFTIALQAIRLLAGQIAMVVLEGLPIADDDLKIFIHCTEIEVLHFNSLNIDGHGLANFENCATKLRYLQLSFMNIGDDDLGYFYGTGRLEVLNLHFNSIYGHGLRAFASCRYHLQSLSLAGNQIKDDGLAAFKGFTELSSIDLRVNFIEGPGLANFKSSFKELQYLDVGINLLLDEHLLIFSPCTKISSLFLHRNRLDGSCLEAFEHSAGELTELSIADNHVSDSSLIAFRSSHQLKHLDLSNCNLSGLGLAYFSNNTGSLENLKLNDNRITDDNLGAF